MKRSDGRFGKHREILLYVVFGALTTLVNLASFYAFTRIWVITPDSTLLPNGIANVLAILFAFVTNRSFVFHSDKTGSKGILSEAIAFFVGRVLTLALDLAVVYVFVDALGWAEMPVKVASTVLVIILNYIISKWIVFQKR